MCVHFKLKKMYIKSIVLDGFKSYGNRVEVNGFDPQFNALTGLNGTGKSNILDAICFVLGISNLKLIRIGNLQELIYKSGQAGVNQATVCLTFDNSNPDHSPPGFESNKTIVVTRQIGMGGKNKYMINGSNVLNKKVQDLFCSVQLNVNNPHFLIMQGRVTKVLGMKPPEILAMLEEAAGTRMYESKRQQAVKMLEKKDTKLEELNAICRDELAPRLDKLKEERSKYLDFQRVERELEHMVGLFQAWQFYATQRVTAAAEKNVDRAKGQIREVENSIRENEENAGRIGQEIEEIREGSHNKTGSNLKNLETELKEVETLEAKATAAEKSAKEHIVSEAKKHKQLLKSIADDEHALKSKEKELENVGGMFQKLKEQANVDAEALALAERKFEAISAGMEINEDGQAQTLQEQLIEAKGLVVQANTNLSKYNKQLTQCRTQLKEKQNHVGSATANYDQLKKQMDSLQLEVNQLQKSLNKLNYSEAQMQNLQKRRQDLKVQVRSLKERIYQIESRNPRICFNYRDPEANFNKAAVCGKVCRLIKLKDNMYNTAVETAAGGRLFNVIVDNSDVSKKLLQKGQLMERTTFIPLNKIQGGRIDENVVKCAKKLVGKENVHSTLSLINYEQKYRVAMEHVFGGTLVTRDIDMARTVAFSPQVQRLTVTLEGDSVDPRGTLSGGAPLKGKSALTLVQEVQHFEAELQEKEQELEQVENNYQHLSGLEQQYTNLKRQFDVKSAELNSIQMRLQQTTHHQQTEEIEQLKANIEELTQQIRENEEVLGKNEKRATELSNTIKDSKGHQDRKLKQAEADIKSAKTKSTVSKTAWEKHEQSSETLNMEIVDLRANLDELRLQLEQFTSNNNEEDLIQKKAIAEELRRTKSELRSAIKTEKEQIMSNNKSIKQKTDKMEGLLARNAELKLEIKKQEHVVVKYAEELRLAKSRQSDASASKDSKHLAAAKEMKDADAVDLEHRIKANNEKKNKMGRTVNTKAQSLYEHEEKQYANTLKQKRMVQLDRKNISLMIADLDEKKKAAVQLAFDQVSKDFGSIFGTLLPGANATLKVPDGMTILQGLEVKVSLGGVWKDSLSELSGGQRSLVALSLILSMLLFKPAPLYILDEVDAALDLSHTQNIGNMLSTHFKQSQFIIVSLKEGMFNHANVLFRTKFVDGMSCVMKTINKNK